MIDFALKRKQILLGTMLFSWVLIVLFIHYVADQGQIASFGKTVSYLSKYDTLAHFLLIGLLGFFVSMVSKKGVKIGNWTIPMMVIMLILIVCLEETSQYFRVHRGFSFTDMAANVLGILSFNYLAQKIKAKYFYRGDNGRIKF